MQFAKQRHRYASLISIAAVLGLLPGCEKLTPQGEIDTMSLLRSGSEKVCIAPEVQKALRDLILPKPSDLDDEGSEEDKQRAIGTVSIGYELTTLQSFDRAVSRASCSTSVRLTGNESNSNKFALAYEVSPSADNPGTFVISADTDNAKAFAHNLINSALDIAAGEKVGRQRDAEAMQERAKLLPVITPKWLVGTWIEPAENAIDCANGKALTFAGDHSMMGHGLTGRWALDGAGLHLVGRDSSGAIDTTVTIAEADAVSFKTSPGDGSPQALRRCSRSEIETQPDVPDTMTEGMTEVPSGQQQ